MGWIKTTKISIHALREERDRGGGNRRRSTHRISIHALREERDCRRIGYIQPFRDFNPRAPRGARPLRRPSLAATWQFQSTRSARSATSKIKIESKDAVKFQSTRSARSATIYNSPARIPTVISIHALREERDSFRSLRVPLLRYFNPRAPRGARQQKNTKQKSVLCDKHKIL